jgi:predicted RNase H-like nuclease (RuvC/YqgF family)
MEESKDKKNSSNKLFAILSILFAGLSIFLGYQLMNQKKEKEIVMVEKEKLSDEFDATKSQLGDVQKAFEGLTTDNKQLQSELDAKKEEIEEMVVKLNKAKGDSKMIAKLKAEISNLKASLQSFVKQIDSLNIVNKQLTEENTIVKGDLQSEKGKTAQLTQEKTDLTAKVELGSKMKIYEVFSDAIRVKGDKEISTAKAKRADKIRTCFILGENQITKKGDRMLYAKITTPDNQILVTSKDDSNMFTAAGGREYFSAKKQINYNGQSQDICMYYTPKEKEKLKEGKYKAEIYLDNEKVGETSFDLK